MLRTADELDAAEEGNAAGQEHGEGAQLEFSFLARDSCRGIPSAERPAVALVVNVVEKAVLWYQQGVRLERSFWKTGAVLILTGSIRALRSPPKNDMNKTTMFYLSWQDNLAGEDTPEICACS